METLKYCKVRDVKSPTRAHEFDAGIDFFVPNDLDVETMNDKCDITGDHLVFEEEDGIIKSMTLEPGQSVLIPSGIKVVVPENYMLQMTNKSGVASKKHLLVGANVIDCGYEGECHINLHNVGTSSVKISAGDKIVQGIIIPVECAQPEEIQDEKTLYRGSSSLRGEGGFGSSGN